MTTQNLMQHSPTYCQHAWSGIDISSAGGVKPCCRYGERVADSIDAYLTSDHRTSLQQQLASGQKPEGCNRCWADEAAGIQSKRQLDNEVRFQDRDPQRISVMSFSFGNVCNLACRTCDSFSSSRWITQEQKLKPRFPEIKIHPISKHYKDTTLLSQVQAIASTCNTIEIVGGEPFLAAREQHLDFLTGLVSNGHAQHINLHYTTNTTIFPDPEFWGLLFAFNSVDFQLSIDATHEKFEYMRWPAVWDECESNIRRYLEVRDSNSKVRIGVSHTVSLINALDYPEFAAWCLRTGFRLPNCGFVSQPEHYSLDRIPAILARMMLECRKWPTGTPVWNRLRAAAQRDQNDRSQLDKFIQYTESLDLIRKQDFATTFPTLNNLINQYIQNA